MERILVTEQMAKEMGELARQVKPLHYFLMKRGVSYADASDIVQEAFIKVFDRRESLPESLEQRKAILFGEVNLRMWAHFTEQTRSIDRGDRAREHFVIMGMTEQRDMSGVLEVRQLLELILLELSPEQYQVFTDKVLDDLTIREVAENLQINAHTTKTYWFRALEVLREKLESVEHRGGRGLIVVVVIASILGLAKNARAMFEMLVRFFRAIRRMHIHNLAGMAAGGVIMFSPPNSGASVHDAQSLSRHEVSARASGVAAEPKSGVASNAAAKNEIGDTSSLSIALPYSKSPTNSRQMVSKKPAMKAGTPDYLISLANAALRNGQPEKALTLLDQYAAVNAKAANSGMVNMLRTEAREAMNAH